MMNILQISNTDFQGMGYNGFDLHLSLQEKGFNADEIVVYKRTECESVKSFMTDIKLSWQYEFNQFQMKTSLLNLVEPFGGKIKAMEEFQKADIVHFQLLHNHVITIQEFGKLCRMKPSVWTIHDLWAFTGHCIHPMNCSKWKIGCKDCPHLEDPFFPLEYEKAHELWRVKEKVYKNINPDIVVASDFTKCHVKQSPLTSHFTNVHKIPFGIKTNEHFKSNSRELKKKWGIPEENVVIGFRLNDSKLKGVKYLIKAIERMKADNITVLSVDRGNPMMLNSIRNKYQIVELGTQDREGMEQFYELTDIFVMPSLAETFGLMAVEAMAHKCTVVVFEGTVLSEITFAPECGISVPMKDDIRLGMELDRLTYTKEERMRRGELGKKIVKENYRYEDYVNKHIELYKEINERITEKKSHLINSSKTIEEEKEIEDDVAAEVRMKTTMLRELEKKVGWKVQKICIFCAGRFAIKTHEILRKNGVLVDFLCDNDPNKWGYWNYELSCISKEELLRQRDCTLVIIANKYPDSIRQELQELGFKYLIDFYELEEIDKNMESMFKKTTYDKIAELNYADDSTLELLNYLNKRMNAMSEYYEREIKELKEKIKIPKKLKAIAMYLPQFHETEENNKWWGEGYTEWTAVKRAKVLYEGHYQPHIPMNQNYYNLLNKETMEWQAALANASNIYGFCFYHYWFKDGKRVLEKPAENLLKWKDIKINFCFSWANESWIRTWSNVKGGNSWVADELNSSIEGADEHGVLLEQQYGNEKDWIEHFNYLLPFFLDERYIKKDGKPLFMIYRPELVNCMDEMIKLWKSLAKENGLPGIYVMCANCEYNIWQEVDARFIQEFNYSYSIDSQPTAEAISWEKGILTYDYDVLWKNVIDRQYDLDEEVYLGACVEFDCTPRHGKKGNLTIGANPEKFEHYFEELCKKSIRRNNEFVFINAWNEWGEGMHLEPDEKNGFKYLDAVKNAITKVNQQYQELSLERDVLYKKGEEKCIDGTKYNYIEKRAEKFAKYFDLFDNWFRLKEQGESISERLVGLGYHKIVIYGMGKIGKHLLFDLQNSSVEVRYAIDRNADYIDDWEVAVYRVQDYIENVDAVIVTAIFDFENIRQEILKYYNCPIINLNELLR